MKYGNFAGWLYGQMTLFSRPLVPVVCAYSAGLWLVHEVYHDAPWLAAGIAAILLFVSVAGAIVRRELTAGYILILFALGVVVMGSRELDYRRAVQILPELQGPGMKIITGTIASSAELSDTELARVTLTDVKISSGSQVLAFPGKLLVMLKGASMAGKDELPATGERISFPGTVTGPVALRNFFGYDRLEALRHEGIYGTARPMALAGVVHKIITKGSLRAAVDARLSGIRKSISQNLLKSMWNREGRLMVAMLFNDMRNLTDAERQVFRVSGTFHLFAVSGMHVAILGFALNLVFRTIRMGVRGSWLAVAVVLFFYLWLIGFVPSATRSYLMLLGFTAAYALGREVDSLTSLVFAIAVVLVYDPTAWWKAGFILSVAGVASIVLLAPRVDTWWWSSLGRNGFGWAWNVKRRLKEAVSVCVAVTVFMLPLQLYYFGFWNLLSPVANLLQAGLSTIVLSAGAITAVCSVISESLTRVIGQSTSAVMWLIYQISHWAAEGDWAVFYVRQVPLWLMLSCYAILASGYYMVYRDSPEFRFKGRARFVTHSFCCLSLLAGFQLWWTLRPQQLEIWAMDVGQGDATLVKFPNGLTMLIDGGMGEPDMGQLVVVPQLRGLGIDVIDYLVATHDDADHTGGLASVIREMRVRNLILPAQFEAKSPPSRAMMEQAKKNFVVITELAAGSSATVGDCQVDILNPYIAIGSGEKDNDRSVVVRVRRGNFVALFTGDAGLAMESRMISEGQAEPLSLLKLGHHGSRSSSGEEFIRATRPVLALVSCGVKNQFGHPNAEVLRRVAEVGSRVLRTDEMGAVRISVDEKGVNVTQCVKTPG